LNKSSGEKTASKPERLPIYSRPRQVKFEGRIDALKGHIYNYTDSFQADLYTRTTMRLLAMWKQLSIMDMTWRLQLRLWLWPLSPYQMISRQTHQLQRWGIWRRELTRLARNKRYWRKIWIPYSIIWDKYWMFWSTGYKRSTISKGWTARETLCGIKPSNFSHKKTRTKQGVAFERNVEPTKHPRRKFTKDHIRFYNSSKTGHYSNECTATSKNKKMKTNNSQTVKALRMRMKKLKRMMILPSSQILLCSMVS